MVLQDKKKICRLGGKMLKEYPSTGLAGKESEGIYQKGGGGENLEVKRMEV